MGRGSDARAHHDESRQNAPARTRTRKWPTYKRKHRYWIITQCDAPGVSSTDGQQINIPLTNLMVEAVIVRKRHAGHCTRGDSGAARLPSPHNRSFPRRGGQTRRQTDDSTRGYLPRTRVSRGYPPSVDRRGSRRWYRTPETEAERSSNDGCRVPPSRRTRQSPDSAVAAWCHSPCE